MFGPTEGIVWMAKGAVGAWYQDTRISPNEDREKLKKEQEKAFYESIYLDIALNGKNKVELDKKHPRTEYAVGGATESFDRISVMYGKNPHAISRVHTLHQDGALFAHQDTQAFLAIVPMPEADERFVWLDLTYGVRGVYFPFCFDLPWPYDNFVQLVRLDFKHRPIRMPFARPYDPMLVSQPERDLLLAQIEKAGLEIMPERSIIDGDILHPVLQDTTRFTKKILGEKTQNSDGKATDEKLFSDASTNPDTKRDKAALHKWLSDCTGKGPKEELDRAKKLNELAEKYRIDRNPKYYRAEIDQDDLIRDAAGTFKDSLKHWLQDYTKKHNPVYDILFINRWVGKIMAKTPFKDITIKQITEQSGPEREGFVDALVKEFGDVFMKDHMLMTMSHEEAKRRAEGEDQIEKFRQSIFPDWKKACASNDEFLTAPDFTPHAFNERLTLLSSPGGEPDCLVSGHIDFATEPTLGLGLEKFKATVRIDVREALCCLAVPQDMAKREGGKEVGYQNVAGSAGQPIGLPIDFYSRNLVLAFAARDIMVAPDANTFTTKITSRGINYSGIIKSQWGLTMSYAAPPTPIEKQVALMMVQLLAVAADAIPVVGPLVSFGIYVGGNTIIDSSWPSQFENSAPPLFALIYSQKGSVSKYAGNPAKKVKFALKK